MLNGVLADTIKDATVLVSERLAPSNARNSRLRPQNSLAQALSNHQIQLDGLTQI